MENPFRKLPRNFYITMMLLSLFVGGCGSFIVPIYKIEPRTYCFWVFLGVIAFNPEIPYLMILGNAIKNIGNMKRDKEDFYYFFLYILQAIWIPLLLLTTMTGQFPWGFIWCCLALSWIVKQVCSLGDPAPPEEKYYNTHDYKKGRKY